VCWVVRFSLIFLDQPSASLDSHASDPFCFSYVAICFLGDLFPPASSGSAWSNVESQGQLVTDQSPLQCAFKHQWIRVLECVVYLVEDFAECQGPVAVE